MLDEIENAHTRVGGNLRGRRYATEQINHAYAMILSSQFQGFCRDLHTECVDALVGEAPAVLHRVLRTVSLGSFVGQGESSPGNLGSDFGRLGLEFWNEVRNDFHQNDRRQGMLEELNRWRNAIAHQDFDPAVLGATTTLHLAVVRGWRMLSTGFPIFRSCDVFVSDRVARRVALVNSEFD